MASCRSIDIRTCPSRHATFGYTRDIYLLLNFHIPTTCLTLSIQWVRVKGSGKGSARHTDTPTSAVTASLTYRPRLVPQSLNKPTFSQTSFLVPPSLFPARAPVLVWPSLIKHLNKQEPYLEAEDEQKQQRTNLPTASPRPLSYFNLRIDLAHSKVKDGITLARASVLELRGRVGADDGDAELETLSRTPRSCVRQRVREGQVRGEQAGLREDGPLVPVDVLVVEPVAADVDDRDEGDAEGLVRWGDAGEAGCS